MKAVFLVINYMPHQLVSINSLIKNYNVEVFSFYYLNNTPIPLGNDNLSCFNLNDFSRPELLKKIMEIRPSILVVAGWAITDYVWVAKQIRKKISIPVVTYSDTQWLGTWKQRVNSLISHWHVKKAFSHIWVSGIYQYEYARKLGFSKTNIIYNSLSCDIELFRNNTLNIDTRSYPKNFLFMGRFVPVKGLDLLIDAWRNITNKKGWTLTLIGDGPEKWRLQNIEGVILKNHMSQKEIAKEMETAGCFILPSLFEQWGLVLHEAAASGLPIIATNICGATPNFVISGYNGLQIKPNMLSIKIAIERFINMDITQLIQYSKNSRELAEKITPEIGSAQLMSVIYAVENT